VSPKRRPPATFSGTLNRLVDSPWGNPRTSQLCCRGEASEGNRGRTSKKLFKNCDLQSSTPHPETPSSHPAAQQDKRFQTVEARVVPQHDPTTCRRSISAPMIMQSRGSAVRRTVVRRRVVAVTVQRTGGHAPASCSVAICSSGSRVWGQSTLHPLTLAGSETPGDIDTRGESSVGNHACEHQAQEGPPKPSLTVPFRSGDSNNPARCGRTCCCTARSLMRREKATDHDVRSL
jgi:hypothetical protein